MSKQKLREDRRAKQRKKNIVNSLIWGAIIVVLLALGGYLFAKMNQPALGEKVPIMANASEHLSEGENPGPFNSDPPTSGRHYGQPLDAGFYEAGDPATPVIYPEGYLLHNLEHGYVIFWYNCETLDTAAECDALKIQIKDVMSKFLEVKLIAFPWPSLDVPVVMTSWGYMLRFDEFDQGQARSFISANRNHAPEPNAP